MTDMVEDIELAYQEMAAEEDREREALDWSDALIVDAAGDESTSD
jgi:hypothetical protein